MKPLALLILLLVQLSQSADLVIRIPGDLSQQDGFYRLDYNPPVGFPGANTTFRPQAISDVIGKLLVTLRNNKAEQGSDFRTASSLGF